MTTDNESGKKVIDNLTEDTAIPGQEWICMSFMSPEGIKGCKTNAFKFRGAFATQEEANKHAEKLRNSEPDFDIYVGEGFKWCGWNPDPHSIDDQQYMEKDMQRLHDGYMKNKKNVSEEEEKRRHTMRKEGLEKERSTRMNNEKDRRQKTRERLQKKIAERQNINARTNNNDDESHTNELIKQAESVAKQKRQIIEQDKETVEKETKQIDSIENDLDEMQKEYEALLAKRNKLKEEAEDNGPTIEN